MQRLDTKGSKLTHYCILWNSMLSMCQIFQLIKFFSRNNGLPRKYRITILVIVWRVKYDDRFVIFLLSIIKIRTQTAFAALRAKRITIILYCKYALRVICRRNVYTYRIYKDQQWDWIDRNASIYFVPRFDPAENIVVSFFLT